MVFTATFLGVGAAHASGLGNSSLLIEADGRPWMMIDCGFDSLSRYKTHHPEQLPPAVFITHCHFDHIGGLEQLYFQSRFTGVRPTIYISPLLIPTLTNVLSNTLIAEGKENVWDILRLLPVQNCFYHRGVKLHTYPVRHHHPNSAFSLHMPGCFFYSGDTRPIPELLHHLVNHSEIIFHDCAIQGNPSHSGVNDLLREYSPSVLNRIVAYHYADEADAQVFLQHKIDYARPGDVYRLPSAPGNNVSYALHQSA